MLASPLGNTLLDLASLPADVSQVRYLVRVCPSVYFIARYLQPTTERAINILNYA